jgi:hydroxymethylbilane synthase
MVQAQLAAGALAERYPQDSFVLEPIETLGDRAHSMALTEASQEGVFVKELERALLEGRAELAVHSAKDLPTSSTSGLVISAFLPRADARDVLIARDGSSLKTLPAGARVGTGSPRRAAQLSAVRPDLKYVPIRGNVDTRLKKLHEGLVDALVIAAAGMERLGRTAEVHEWLPFEVMLPAPGQGALALQARSGSRAAEMAAGLNHVPTSRAVGAERGVLQGLGGGCLSAVGAYAFVDGQDLVVSAVVLAADGGQVIRARSRGPRDQQVVAEVTAQLRAGGAAGLLRARATELPLEGLRVMVTRASRQAGAFIGDLQAAGATVLACPVIEIQPLPVEPEQVQAVASYDWIVFTSVNAVERFLGLLEEAGASLPPAAGLAAIGPETAAEMRRRGLAPEVIPELYKAEDLAAAFPVGSVEGRRVLLPRAAGAREVLPERLRAQGAAVDVLEIYRAVPPAGLRSRLLSLLERGVDVVTFTSSSTVRNFVEALGGQRLDPAIKVACIGPITAKTAGEADLRVDIIADIYTARGLVDALVRDRAVRV